MAFTFFVFPHSFSPARAAIVAPKPLKTPYLSSLGVGCQMAWMMEWPLGLVSIYSSLVMDVVWL